ncbi:hypothetical protein Vadar_021652 [Vaccinium darrowii]|uniref:Uncharacterized protein n=1 Tax=Vaccinium darrowii TaxID=229202 RepID=A0ACB7ZD53_9ERIC|nr:hypothetical protein Vadar_021652 [Vaccinium darrowii]
MEKPQEQKDKQTPEKTNVADHHKPIVFDCGSSLYDSFELKSFERHLDSAIASRTLSMPHLPDRPGPPVVPKPISKKPSKFSRSFQKLLKSVFGPKQNVGSLHLKGSSLQDGFYVAYHRSGSLSTIREVMEKGEEYGGVSPDFEKSLAKRAASARFTATSVGISCA